MIRNTVIDENVIHNRLISKCEYINDFVHCTCIVVMKFWQEVFNICNDFKSPYKFVHEIEHSVLRPVIFWSTGIELRWHDNYLNTKYAIFLHIYNFFLVQLQLMYLGLC